MCTCFCRTHSLKSIWAFSAWVCVLVWLTRGLPRARRSILNDLLTNRVDYVCMNRRLYMRKFIAASFYCCICVCTHSRTTKRWWWRRQQQRQHSDNRETTTMNAFKREHCLYAGFRPDSVVLCVFLVGLSSSLTCFPNQSRIWNAALRYSFFAALTIFSTGICEHTTHSPSSPVLCVRNLYLRWNLFRYDFSMGFLRYFRCCIFVGTAGANVALSSLSPLLCRLLLYIAQCLLISHLLRSFFFLFCSFPIFTHVLAITLLSLPSHTFYTLASFFFSFRRTIDLNGRTRLEMFTLY